jgi:hypothetical protein
MTEKQKEQNSNTTLYANFDDYKDQFDYLAFKHPFAHTFLFVLLNNMDSNNIFKLQEKELIDEFNIPKQAIHKSLNILEELGFIEKIKNDNPNIYHINENLFKKVKGPTK